MNCFLKDMVDSIPTCSIKARKEKGHYGPPHLVLLRDERFQPDEVHLSILVPYREPCEEEESGVWLSWLDHNGNVFTPIDNLLARKWVELSKVEPEVLELLQLKAPASDQWKKAMT